jgi:TetR/AcrR family transcriptional regulator, cholesterol catabolism regulator
MMNGRTPSKKKQVEQTATSLFQQRGYAATSMRDMAQALGIEAASLYSHIRSKEEILQNICFRMAQLFFEAQDDALKGFEGTASQKLNRAIVAHIKAITVDTSASAVFFSEWRHLSEPHLSEFKEMQARYEGKFREILHEGLQSGEFVDLDEKFAMLTILSALNWTHQWFKPSGRMSAEEIGQRLADVILNGLRKK